MPWDGVAGNHVQCPHCLRATPLPVAVVTSGDTFICAHCGRNYVVDVWTPEQRRRLLPRVTAVPEAPTRAQEP